MDFEDYSVEKGLPVGDLRQTREQVTFFIERLNEAHSCSPKGNFFQRWMPRVCRHPEDSVRCTHGDEIIGRRYRRRVCMICGRSLKGPLPKYCFFTGKDH